MSKGEAVMTNYSSSERINSVEVTSDTITGRGGLALFSRYLETINVFGILDNKFGHIRKSSKGIVVWVLFKQVFVGYLMPLPDTYPILIT